jgi:hypothetical protein
MENVFKATCVSAPVTQESTLNGNCHNDGPNPAACNASAQAQETVKPTQIVAAYIMSWEMQNDACQRGDQRSCRFRDAELLAIESQGWCLSDAQKWQPAPCKPAHPIKHGFKQSGLNPTFRTYTNNRYGFRVDYPLTFRPEAPPENGDGLSFKSQDGKATLDVSGANNSGFTLKDEFDSAIRNIQGQLGYNKTGGSWFVVTWTDGDNISYMKEFVGPGSRNSLTITFSVEQKSQYDSVVTAIEKSFRPGDLDNSH